MKKSILSVLVLISMAFIFSCANHELSEKRLSDPNALALTNAVLSAVRGAFLDGLSKMKPGETQYNGIDYTLTKNSSNAYTMEFNNYAAIIDGKPLFLTDGDAACIIKDIPSFTGQFKIGKLEVVYDKLERDFEWNFSNEKTQYEGNIEIEDHSYSCVKILFPLKTVMPADIK